MSSASNKPGSSRFREMDLMEQDVGCRKQLISHLRSPPAAGISRMVHASLQRGRPSMNMNEAKQLAQDCGLSKFDSTSKCVVKSGHFSTAFPVFKKSGESCEWRYD